MGRPGISLTLSAAAAVRATSSGSATGASSTSHTPSPVPSRASAAACSASRDLPIPPGPAIVTSRDPPDTSARNSASSATRPTKLVACDGRLWRQRRVVERTQHAEPLGQARSGHLKDPLGAAQVPQPLLAQVLELDPAGQPVGQQRVRSRRHQDLAAMADVKQPGGPVHHRTDIVAVALRADTRMQRHAHPDRQAGRPRLGTGSPLDGHRRAKRGNRVGEHRAMCLAHRLEDLAAGRLDLLADNAVMAGRRRRHGIAVGLPQQDAALDIGKQQRHQTSGNPHLPIVTPQPRLAQPRPRPEHALRRVGARSPRLRQSLSVTLVIGIASRPPFDPARALIPPSGQQAAYARHSQRSRRQLTCAPTWPNSGRDHTTPSGPSPAR